MKRIADTGLLLAALDKSDPFHEWGAAEFREGAPFFTCEAVLAELSFHLESPIPGLKLVERGDLVLDFSLAEESARVLDLLSKYRDRRMELADACLVRMSELCPTARIWTVDKTDFRFYRRNGREAVPCEFPPLKA